ncbi:hypothetical protein VTK73DRAFT_7213 [Phialemonium thermophilum]|uniref:Major facilitator superfamily (MFS) profile domain-containing protein n=1 Tax=Phialemonium thermophilum TaxID=223376 RepID=A0ABR3WG19_9PEZI
MDPQPEGDLTKSTPPDQYDTDATQQTAVDKEPANPDVSEYPEGGLRAWLVAAGTASIMFCTMGYTNSFGVFQAYYMDHQLHNESADRIAWIGSIQSFLIFGTGLLGGPMFDRYGAKIIWPSAVLYVFAIMMTSLCTEYWQFMLSQGLLTGIADGLLMFPAMSATPQYFHKNRGAAMGIAIAGSSLGGVIFPIALAKMLTESDISFGWSIRICGFIMIPFLAFSCLTIRARLPPRKTHFFLPRAFLQLDFNVLILATFCLLIGMYCPLIFLPTYAMSVGVKPTLAAYLVAMLNGASVFGRVLPGIMADKLGRLNILAAAGVSTGILAFVWPHVHGTAGVIVYAIVFGFCSGAIISGGTVALSLCPRDPKDTGTYLGQGIAVAALSCLVGPPVTGAMLDRFGGFTQVSIFAGVFTLAGSALAFGAKATTPKGLLGRI